MITQGAGPSRRCPTASVPCPRSPSLATTTVSDLVFATEAATRAAATDATKVGVAQDLLLQLQGLLTAGHQPGGGWRHHGRALLQTCDASLHSLAAAQQGSQAWRDDAEAALQKACCAPGFAFSSPKASGWGWGRH